ncbi:MAG: hypothetical protein WAZ12_04995 [Candidatus Absconditicoccaceae bacterium]
MKEKIIQDCRKLLLAYQEGKLGYMKMPEDSNPGFSSNEKEICLCYFTLPMALNYQRNSYTLRESVSATYLDVDTKDIFDIKKSSEIEESDLRNKLLKYKIALQPNKHIHTWQTIAMTINNNRGTLGNMFEAIDNDFLKLRETIQHKYKYGFPYLSGPKIFNYRSFIIQTYGKIKLKNSEFIDIAPDTHVTKSSVKLGIITEQEAEDLNKDEISKKWRELLHGSGINPIDMHSPLWFRSRNNFIFKL